MAGQYAEYKRAYKELVSAIHIKKLALEVKYGPRIKLRWQQQGKRTNDNFNKDQTNYETSKATRTQGADVEEHPE